MSDVDVSYGKLVIIDTYDGPGANVEIAKIASSVLAYVDNQNPGVELYTHLTGISAETFYFSNDVFIKNDLTISGNLFFDSLEVSGDSNFKSDINIYNDCSINNNLFVNNVSRFVGQTNILGELVAQGDSTFEGSNNDIRIQGNFNIGTSFANPTFKVLSHTGRTTILCTDPSNVALDINATSGIKIPKGNTAERPNGNPDISGIIRYNTQTQQFEGYATAWQGLGGVIDVNQDTYIIAEDYPTADNNEIKMYTLNVERLRIDACGNVQLKESNNNHVALDIIATSGIKLPMGTKDERPVGGSGTISSDISGTIRYNTDTSLCEIYTASNIWSAFPIYKAEQPPKLLNVYQSQLSESVSVSWSKFNEIYKDVFDGKSNPIYLQTFVDISFSNISDISSNGWKTILIGNGNYNTSGEDSDPLYTINFNSVVETTYNNSTTYDLSFIDKPSTYNLPVFTQDDSFDLRIYGVNKSGTLPNYLYINNVQLKQTAAPGEVTIIDFYAFGKYTLTMDFSFNLDASDTTITEGISIVHYDISYVLSGTKSLVTTRTHSGNHFIEWTNAADLGKDNIQLPNLIPGAKYNIQIRAKNALKFNENGASDDGPTSTNLYKYGATGQVFTATGFTNNSGQSDGLSTTRYIDTGDLNSVNPTEMSFTLNGSAMINCHVAGTSDRRSRNIMSYSNSNSSITINNSSSFYVNYGKQGSDMLGTTALVEANFNAKNRDGVHAERTIEFVGKDEYSALTVDLNSYSFTSSDNYTDEGTSTDVEGFVYSATIFSSSGSGEHDDFTADFPASLDNYYLEYSLTTLAYNNSERIEKNSSITSVNVSTGDFWVDNYPSGTGVTTPQITFNSDPAITITSEVYLFGIPSVRTIKVEANFTISDFADKIIPYLNSRHSWVEAVVNKNCYSFDTIENNTHFTSDSYIVDYDEDASISSGTYDSNTTSDFTIGVYYLDNTGTPTVDEHLDNQKDIPDIGHVFSDTENTYNAFNLHIFNGTNTITTGSTIDVDSTSFSLNDYTLIRFNSKFVSGGYSANYNGTPISPFSDWSSGYAVNGQDYSSYSNTGVDNFKWIAIDINSKRGTGNFANSVDLSQFKISNTNFTNKTFGTHYKAYLSQEIGGVMRFGSLSSNFNSGATPWYNSDITASDTPNYFTIADADHSSANGARYSSEYPTKGIIDTNAGTVYLVVGLPQNGNSSCYFTFS
jgi:hypothetical protein